MRTAPLLLLLLASCATLPAPPPLPAEPPLPFIEDDLPLALRLAKERGKPVFVDAWAPWCHSCRSLRELVLKDPALARHADRFVWLSVDTEREVNTAFLQRYPVESWPTLFVLAPSSGDPVLTWVGTATVPQLERLFDDAERALSAGGEGLEAELAAADRAAAAGDKAAAAATLAKLLHVAPPEWPRRGRALESLTTALYGLADHERCAQAARVHAPGLQRGPSFANSVAMGLACAGSAPRETAWRAETVRELEPLGWQAVSLPTVLADDRSGLYEMLCELRAEAGDAAGAHNCAASWLAFLEREAAATCTPSERAVFDAHRVLAALALGEPQRAVPALLQSEKDLPGDYNAPARLALLYRAQKRYVDAIAASDRALATVYGPRKFGVMEQKAKTLAESGDAAGARALLGQVKAEASLMSPRPPQVTRLLERVEKALSAGDGQAP
jgi:thiol-disulfide isomerase/thioredoxin